MLSRKEAEEALFLNEHKELEAEVFKGRKVRRMVVTEGNLNMIRVVSGVYLREVQC